MRATLLRLSCPRLVVPCALPKSMGLPSVQLSTLQHPSRGRSIAKPSQPETCLFGIQSRRHIPTERHPCIHASMHWVSLSRSFFRRPTGTLTFRCFLSLRSAYLRLSSESYNKHMDVARQACPHPLMRRNPGLGRPSIRSRKWSIYAHASTNRSPN
ncbi:hypothetical protein LXA43DRAFT_1025628 [Ganoderma leucocontextum]|nr:hypothetical protein LXA43DRAFT_1025628 [Ganoderma leucocontextum]